MEARAGDVFVGRARELEELERVLDSARAGNGATALVSGEAGIGKTRLASELASRARDAGFEVLLGRSIDLVGTELPYQPFLEAMRPLGEPWRGDGRTAGSQLQAFEETLALLTNRAASAPVLLILEDLHWADTSTLDLVVYLAHNLGGRQVLLLATYRADEPGSAERVRRVADGVRRSGSGVVLELGPLEDEELAALVAAHAGGVLPGAVTNAIVSRSEGNPFFAEELLAAAGDDSVELPRRLRDLLLQRIGRLSKAFSSPTRQPAASASATPCSPRRSTRRSSPASARSFTRSWPKSSRAAELRRRRSSRSTGRRRVAAQRRSPRRSTPHAKRRPSSDSRRLTPSSSGRSCSGMSCRTRLSS